MLSLRTLVERDGVAVADVACRHARGRGEDEETAGVFAVVLVRRGCFVRSTANATATLDPTLGYCLNPDEPQRYDHPHRGGDDCTAILLERALVASLCGGEDQLPGALLPSPPDVDLAHRRLLADAIDGDDSQELAERAIDLAARTLEQVDARRLHAGRPATELERRRLVDGAREALVADSSRSLPELSRELAVSPHHLSRVFSSATGLTISRHRMRLRVREGLERLAAGESNLARLAAELGFADQGHMCRVVRSETGNTPTALRRALEAEG
jgi:AraC-like DNA-binding protein